MAANWKLPIIWVCENNELAMFVPVKDAHPTKDIADLAHGYGMPGVVVDGQDVMLVAEAVKTAIERARKGNGPSLIECKCTRYHPHAIGLPDMVDCDPRTDECIMELKERDPVDICRDRLMSEGILSKEDVKRIERDAENEVKAAEKFADDSPIADDSELESLLYAQ
jgi:pyruvate dehydrogenase E1 component alpha subunit